MIIQVTMAQNSTGSCRMQTSKVMRLTNTTSHVNGTVRSKMNLVSDKKPWHSSGVTTHCFGKEYKDESKSRFSEKLKVLLENGGISDKLDDPYTFQEVEQFPDSKQFTGSNYVGTMQKCRSVMTQEASNPMAGTIKGATSVSPHFNFKPCDILPRHPAEAAKVKSPLLKPPKVAMTVPSPKSFQNATAKVKPINAPSNVKSTGGGKPLNFAKSQMSKLAIAKIEKTIESRNKNISKGTSSHSIHKTASISKFLPKPKRTPPTRSASLDSSVSAKGEGRNKTKPTACKSLLEESLLGLKKNDGDRTLSSLGMLEGGLAPVPETASTTVPTVPTVPVHLNLRHESLQRIWALRNRMQLIKRNYQQFDSAIELLQYDAEPEDQDTDSFLYQNHWFSLCNDYDSFAGHNRKREAKLAQLKTELRHKLSQQQWRHRDDYRVEMARLLITTARQMPNLAAFLVRLENSSHRMRSKVDRSGTSLGTSTNCVFTEGGCGPCCARAVPGAPFCPRHITHHTSQLIFSSCVAVVPPQNTQCGAPALGKESGMGICARHLRLMPSVQKPKLIATDKSSGKSALQGKRSRSSLGSSRSGRSRKRKKQLTKEKKDPRDVVDGSRELEYSISQDVEIRSSTFTNNAFIVSKSDVDVTCLETQDVEVGEEVLAIASTELPLDSVELATLATQATRLLEEHDFNNVLGTITADAFNDLFTEDKEEYEPTPQETEELERALEAVDNDVKSLEKLSQTQGLLDMLDEQSIAQTLAALPEVVPVLYQNGFAGIGTIGPLEQTLCDALPSPLLISPHADVLHS